MTLRAAVFFLCGLAAGCDGLHRQVEDARPLLESGLAQVRAGGAAAYRFAKDLAQEVSNGPISLFTGCAAVRQRLGMALVPLETEVALGAKIAAQVESTQRLYPDRALHSYAQQVVARLALAGLRDRPGIAFSVAVLDDKDVNAFAIPGGRMYVYTGLLRLAGDESELAGALAHEMGHVTSRHIANQLATQYGLELLATLALGQDPNALAQIAAQVSNQGMMARFSRDDELAADQCAFRYLIAAGYDPRGLVSLFGKLAQGEDRQSSLEAFLATHPDTAERIRRIDRMIEQAGSPGGRRESERYRREIAVLGKG